MEIGLYDYISLMANSSHSNYVEVDYFMDIMLNEFSCEKTSNASCYFKIGHYCLRVQGISCDRNGNYNFNSDKYLKKINLIEINLPQGSESQYEAEIITFTKSLADKMGWEIDWRI